MRTLSLNWATNTDPSFRLDLRISYRLIALFSLPFFLGGFASCLFAEISSASAPVAGLSISRMELLEKASKSFFDRPISELEVMQRDFYDPFPDGKIHLDWPVTRGAAAKALLRLLKGPSKDGQMMQGVHPCPGFFSDIAVGLPLYQVLFMVGGAFPVRAGKRFAPDTHLTTEDLQAVLNKLSKRFLEPESPTASAGVTVLPGKTFQPSFRFQSGREPTVSDLLAGSDTARIEKLLDFVPKEQVAPAPTFDIHATDEAVTEMEMILDSLEKNVQGLLVVKPTDPGETRELRNALLDIRTILGPLLNKLRFSAMQLSSALLVDSDSIRLAAQLKHRLASNRSRLKHLQESLETGINKIPRDKEGENP